MKQLTPLFMLAWLTLWTPLAAAQQPKPGPKDLCPVCGLLVSKYPNWVFLLTYAPAQRSQHIAGLHVTDFYNLGKVDAHKAFYVIGSDVLGPTVHFPRRQPSSWISSCAVETRAMALRYYTAPIAKPGFAPHVSPAEPNF